MGDYHVKVSIKNGRIIRRMRAAGIESLSRLAEVAGVSYQSVWKLAAMRETPSRKDGEWRSVVIAVATALRCQPDELFNEQQLERPLAHSSGETFMDLEQVRAITSGSQEAAEARLSVQKLLTVLTPRERHIVESISEGATFEEACKLTEIGERWDVCTQRARQIYAKGIRKMKGEAARMARHAAWRDVTQEGR